MYDLYKVKCVCVRTCKERGCRHDQTIHHLHAEDLDGRQQNHFALDLTVLTSYFEVMQEQATAILTYYT